MNLGSVSPESVQARMDNRARQTPPVEKINVATSARVKQELGAAVDNDNLRNGRSREFPSLARFGRAILRRRQVVRA
jgi:hypothetical protein